MGFSDEQSTEGKSVNTSQYVNMIAQYSELTKGAAKVIAKSKMRVLPLFEEKKLLPLGENALTFLDLGAADGGTALAFWSDLVRRVHLKAKNQSVTLISNDLPGSDYNSLFRFYSEGEPGLKHELAPFYIHANGTPFFEQVAANGSIDFSFSATAMHWLSEVPAVLTDHIHSVESRDEQGLLSYQKLAEKNWRQILQSRWAELKPGSYFFVLNFCRSPEGRYLGHTTGKSMFTTFANLWRELVTQEEFRQTNFPQYYRSLDELEGPARQLGFEVASHEVVETQCPYKMRFKEGELTPEQYAEIFLPTMTTWSTPVFLHGLRQTRTPQEAQSKVNELWANYKNLIQANPEDYQMDYVHSFLLLRKPSDA